MWLSFQHPGSECYPSLTTISSPAFFSGKHVLQSVPKKRINAKYPLEVHSFFSSSVLQLFTGTAAISRVDPVYPAYILLLLSNHHPYIFHRLDMLLSIELSALSPSSFATRIPLVDLILLANRAGDVKQENTPDVYLNDSAKQGETKSRRRNGESN